MTALTTTQLMTSTAMIIIILGTWKLTQELLWWCQWQQSLWQHWWHQHSLINDSSSSHSIFSHQSFQLLWQYWKLQKPHLLWQHWWQITVSSKTSTSVAAFKTAQSQHWWQQRSHTIDSKCWQQSLTLYIRWQYLLLQVTAAWFCNKISLSVC